MLRKRKLSPRGQNLGARAWHPKYTGLPSKLLLGPPLQSTTTTTNKSTQHNPISISNNKFYSKIKTKQDIRSWKTNTSLILNKTKNKNTRKTKPTRDLGYQDLESRKSGLQ